MLTHLVGAGVGACACHRPAPKAGSRSLSRAVASTRPYAFPGEPVKNNGEETCQARNEGSEKGKTRMYVLYARFTFPKCI